MKTILLIHGWNYRNYKNIIKKEHCWSDRIKFVNKLKESYKIYSPDLPGFGSEDEPGVLSWNLDNYVKYINEYIKKNKINPDYIIGYSFGGAVAVRYKSKINKNAKLVLISPAIVRNNISSKKFISTPKVIKPLRNKLRDMYSIYFIKTPEMVYGTKFLRNTYQSVVREELIDELEKFEKSDFLIIYGDKDNMVDPERLKNTIDRKFLDRIHFIKDAGHDIANTHTKELINLITKEIK